MAMRPSLSVSIAILYPLPHFTQHVPARARSSCPISVRRWRARSPSLSSFLPYLKSRKLAFNQKRRDPFVTRFRIGVGEQQKEARFGGVGDPELAPSRQKISPHRSARVPKANASDPDPASDSAYAAMVSAASRGRYFAFCSGVAQRTARYCRSYSAHRQSPPPRIHRRKLLHRQYGLEKRASLTAVFLRDLDRHQAHLENWAHDILAKAQASSISRTYGRIWSRANFRTVVWKRRSSSLSAVSGVISPRYPTAAMARQWEEESRCGVPAQPAVRRQFAAATPERPPPRGFG